MPQKQATYISYGTDERCDEIRKFIEDAGIRLRTRDLREHPMSFSELDHLFGYNPLTYFLNPLAPEYSKLGLDKKLPERRELLQMMADHPAIMRRPIIKSSRLLTAGCDRKTISIMLQISPNGTPIEPNNHVPDQQPRRRNRRAASPSGR